MIRLFDLSQAKKSAQNCRDPGSNRGPPDLQSDALPTELSRLENGSITLCKGSFHLVVYLPLIRKGGTFSKEVVFVYMTVWPSGLRRQAQVLMEQSAWVRTPPLSIFSSRNHMNTTDFLRRRTFVQKRHLQGSNL